MRQTRKLCCVTVLLFITRCNCLGSVVEQKRNAPDSGKGNDSVYNSADDGALASENPCNKVKLKKTDESPVDGSDDVSVKDILSNILFPLLLVIADESRTSAIVWQKTRLLFKTKNQ